MKSKIFVYIIMIFATCFFASFISCKKDKKEFKTISFDLKSSNDNLEFKIKSLIKLETSDSSLIGEITKVALFKERFFVLDRMVSKTLFVFDKNGKFISKTKRGKGPGECLSPWDFFIDSVSQKIHLWDQANTQMMDYDINLKHIQSKYFKGINLKNMESISNDTLLVFGTVWDENNKTKNISFFRYCIYTNTLKNPISKMLPTTEEFKGMGLETPICKTNRIIFTAPLDNNIYGIDKLRAKILYNLDFGIMNITNNDVKKGISYVFDCARNGSRITSIDNPLEDKNYLSFSFYYMDRYNFFIHSKSTNNNYYSEKVFNEKKLPRCILKGINTDGSFLAVSSPPEIKDFEFKDINLKKEAHIVDNQDNPYIFIFNINEIK